MKYETKIKKDVANLIYGRNPLLSFLNSKHIDKVYLQKGFSDKNIISKIEECGLNPIYMDIKELDRICENGNHQGCAAEVKPFEYSSLKEVIKYSKNQEKPLILILDEVNDPHNFGAIIRSADAFHVDAIIIKNRNQVPVNMTVTKVSTGAVDYVKIVMVNNLVNAIKELKENGFWVYAADGSGKDDYSKAKFDGPVALVMGSEGFGIARLVLKNSDFIIKIPMSGHVNSLNVSVATGIILSRIRN
jgi:23S rRNA (guanosine2251-2'-O)-methyltransferase